MARVALVPPDPASMAGKKTEALRGTTAQGHRMGAWVIRTGDTYGRQDAHCLECYAVATVATIEPTPYELPFVYGAALTTRCPKATT